MTGCWKSKPSNPSWKQRLNSKMNTILIPINHPGAMSSALEVLNNGGLVAFPTDTVYGLGVSVFNGQAIEGIYQAKNRPLKKSIPILIGDIEDLAKVSGPVPEIALKLAARFWPGPLTLIIPKRPDLPKQVSSTPTVGVRMPDYLIARSLLRLVGPMAVTSANLSGRASPSTAEEVLGQLSGRIALILDGGKTPGGVPSTVVDCLGAELKVLREGPITKDEILAFYLKIN
jgi:L-threonylcarbamoyladenylate synthase